jgi:hypothetical protein
LSVEFFNKLLAYRNNYQQRQDGQDGGFQQTQSYAEWYAKNFGRSHSIAASVQQNLQEAFDGKGETRILDLFIDLPKETENMYLAAHFEKLDKDFANITKASKQTDLLTSSINFMETMRQIEANQKALKRA